MTTLILPLTRLQLAFNVNLRTFTQIFTSHFCQFSIQSNSVPFGFFLLFTCGFITPGFGGRDGDIRYCAAAWHITHFRILA
ncbi:Uncharacterised protein [Vibrio cholerae]|nr:Uncharacterised protein [Vibrio cholerae]CSB72230.1 Uncharacterised protein [Vibrio cholerae]CSC40819.1 Uncharacterised protein [Vibrio cholerae]CSC71653.1 Uncharacterised protein [Vibrio cholerae]